MTIRNAVFLIIAGVLTLSRLGTATANDSDAITPAQESFATVWQLGEEEFATVGSVRPIAGPRPPEFPDLPDQNNAVKFDGRGSRIVIQHAADDDSLQFRGGDTITIAAWIAPRKGNDGSHRYIVGKGRTGSKGFRRDNQNWALRITPKGKGCQLSFLFASADGPDNVNWHRWTTEDSILTA